MIAPIVVFDLDGTLVDTAPDLVATLNAIFDREGLPPVAYEEARNMVGWGARAMIERGLAADDRKLVQARVDGLVEDFIAHYAAHIAVRSRPFPDLEPVLDELAGAGRRFAVCTNKLEWLAVRLLDALGLSARFAVICGADTFGLQKPNPDLLRRTIAAAGAHQAQAIMVGDSITDIAMARAADIPIIAVDYGYTDTPVADLAPDRIISKLSDLPKAVSDLLPAAARIARR